MKSFALVAFLFLSSFLFGQTIPDFSFDVDGQAYNLEDFLQIKKVKGASIYLLDGDGREYFVQSGQRDAENNLAVNRQTLFQAGSMTAAVSHFAVLRLVNDGRVDLDAAANDYLKSWKINKKGFTNKDPVTVRDLLLHARQFNKDYKPRGYEPGRALPTLAQILNGAAPSQESKVRLKKNRNKNGNSNFANVVIIQQLLEDVHGLPLATILQKEVFEPLGMKNSMIRAELSAVEKENAAVGYTQEGQPIEGDRWIYPEAAHSGLWCTAEDYGRFAQHILLAAQGKDNRFINLALGKASVTPASANSNKSLIFHKFNNLGWGGASRGFRTQFNGNLEAGWVAVIFINSHENWQVMNDLSQKCQAFLTPQN